MAATDLYLPLHVDAARGVARATLFRPIYYKNTVTVRVLLTQTKAAGVGVEPYDLTSKVLKLYARRMAPYPGLVTAQLLNASGGVWPGGGFAQYGGVEYRFRGQGPEVGFSTIEKTFTVDTPATAGTAYVTLDETDTQSSGLYVIEIRETNTAGTVRLVLGLAMLTIEVAGETGVLGVNI